jgi:hypothetical protein
MACYGGSPGRHCHCRYHILNIELDLPLLLVNFNWRNSGEVGENGVPNIELKIRI